jgi:SPX domain protein involved in polyphosphate accumulation
MRYENKFVFDESSYSDVLARILMAHGNFTEIYSERTVNNIYLDTFDYKNYYDNINGVMSRVKERIRWYGDKTNAHSPILEYKIKEGYLGSKEYFSMPDLCIDDTFEYNNYLGKVEEYIDNDDNNIDMLNKINAKIPTLNNSYNRRYFLSADGRYRITIDKDICFTSIGYTYTHPVQYTSQNIVVELKYEKEDISGASTIIQDLGFRIINNSKYITGIQTVGLCY